MTARVILEVGASGGLHLGTTVPAPAAGPRARLPGSGHGAGSGPARTKAVNRNAKRLLVYVLDVAATLAQNQVVIDLARRQRKTTGEWGPLRPWYYAPHAAHVKYDPEDRLILALLDEAQGTTAHGVYSTPVPRAMDRHLGPARQMGQVRRQAHDRWVSYSSAARLELLPSAHYGACAGSSFGRIRRPWSNGWREQVAFAFAAWICCNSEPPMPIPWSSTLIQISFL